MSRGHSVSWPANSLATMYIICMTLGILAPPLAHSQGLASLRGVVSDMTGAVIPGADITIRSVQTGLRTLMKSGPDGSYAFLQIPPGTYQITANQAGFKTVTLDGVRLLVNTPATMDIHFEQIGSVSESIEVKVTGVQLNTVDASLGNSFGTLAIVQLPFD
jgi:carboxypeptidase family protein